MAKAPSSKAAVPDHLDSLAANLEWTAKNADGFPRGHSMMDAIRRKCIDCSAGYSAEILRCEIIDCALWPFRMHKNPFHARTGKPQPEALRAARLRKLKPL